MIYLASPNAILRASAPVNFLLEAACTSSALRRRRTVVVCAGNDIERWIVTPSDLEGVIYLENQYKM